MSDVVVTVPKSVWDEWLREGDLPGQLWSGEEYAYSVTGHPDIKPGERVYVVAHDRLRGYAPLIRIRTLGGGRGFPRVALIRGGGAVACTIDEKIPGFRGYRYRWWKYEDERPFPEWAVPETSSQARAL